MESSNFQSLPRELRDAIWTFTLQLSEDIHVFDENGVARIDTDVAEQHPLALTQTCRQIRTESQPLFFQLNKFCLESSILTQPYQLSTCKIPDDTGFRTFEHWIDNFNPGCSSALRTINVSMGELHHTYVAEDDLWPRSWTIEALISFLSSLNTSNVSWSLSFVAHAWPPRAPLPVNIEFTDIKLDAPFAAIERALTDRNDGYDIAMKEGKLRVEAHATFQDAVKLCGARARRFVSVVREGVREKIKMGEIGREMERSHLQ